MCLLQLIAGILNIGQVQSDLSYVFQAFVLWVEKGTQTGVEWSAKVEADCMIQRADSDLMTLF